jgi:hypothetical protein
MGALVVAYTAWVHQGLASPAGGMATEWWHPTGFLRDWESTGAMIGRPVRGVLALSLPAALGTGVVFLSTRSAVARTIAVCGVICCAIMSFYGLTRAVRVWEFFHWRGTAVIVWTSIGVGCTLAAPLLARRWLRLGPTAKALTYLPFLVVTLSVMRNATGYDEALFFAISPWPAIPVLGLDIGAYTLLGMMLGGTLALACLSNERAHPLLRYGGAPAGVAFAVLWFEGRFEQTGARGLTAVGIASAVVVALALITRGPGRVAKLRSRALHVGVGAALVALPLLSGRALSEGDYAVTRHVRAMELIGALSEYYHQEYEYPDELESLIEAGLLDEIPRPRIGFQIYYWLGWLEPIVFDYQSLGSSYVLEFVATEWVMCAYNPPWEELDEEEEEEEEVADEEALAAQALACFEECNEVCLDDCDEGETGCISDCADDCAEQCDYGSVPGGGEPEDDEENDEAWSCPNKRPDLW